jgi:hypothetical protein
VTDGQMGVCPQCGSAAEVHSIDELAAITRARLNTLQQQGGSQQGFGGEPQQGPVPGWAAEPQAGAPGGRGGGWQGGGWQGGGRQSPWGVARDMDFGGSVADDIAGAAVAGAAGMLARAIGKRVQKAMNEKVMPTVNARGEAGAREQLAIAERYPNLRACMADHVIFLEGGSRVVPMKEVNLGTVTLAQADQLVARLQG